jgi:hypothetical protein
MDSRMLKDERVKDKDEDGLNVWEDKGGEGRLG